MPHQGFPNRTAVPHICCPCHGNALTDRCIIFGSRKPAQDVLCKRRTPMPPAKIAMTGCFSHAGLSPESPYGPSTRTVISPSFPSLPHRAIVLQRKLKSLVRIILHTRSMSFEVSANLLGAMTYSDRKFGTASLRRQGLSATTYTAVEVCIL